VQAKTYEIIFKGHAWTVLHAEFADCVITEGPATTTLLAELPDQGALLGLMLSITGLGLELIHLQIVAPLRAE
jgi:hypothetical protein